MGVEVEVLLVVVVVIVFEFDCLATTVTQTTMMANSIVIKTAKPSTIFNLLLGNHLFESSLVVSRVIESCLGASASAIS